MVRILLVEDSPSTRVLMGEILRAAGRYVVEEAPSGFEAMRMLSRSQYQLVVTDINMPDIHGLELIAKMRRTSAYRDTPILVVSTQSESRDVQRALALGANVFLRKPFSADELLTQVADILGSGHG